MLNYHSSQNDDAHDRRFWKYFWVFSVQANSTSIAVTNSLFFEQPVHLQELAPQLHRSIVFKFNVWALSKGIFVNKATTEMHRSCLKSYEMRYTLVKRNEKLPAFPWASWLPKKPKEWPASRTRSERDTTLHNLRPSRDKTDRVACQYTLGIFLLECQVSWNTAKTRYKPEKRDWHEFW